MSEIISPPLVPWQERVQQIGPQSFAQQLANLSGSSHNDLVKRGLTPLAGLARVATALEFLNNTVRGDKARGFNSAYVVVDHNECVAAVLNRPDVCLSIGGLAWVSNELVRRRMIRDVEGISLTTGAEITAWAMPGENYRDFLVGAYTAGAKLATNRGLTPWTIEAYKSPVGKLLHKAGFLGLGQTERYDDGLRQSRIGTVPYSRFYLGGSRTV